MINLYKFFKGRGKQFLITTMLFSLFVFGCFIVIDQMHIIKIMQTPQCLIGFLKGIAAGFGLALVVVMTFGYTMKTDYEKRIKRKLLLDLDDVFDAMDKRDYCDMCEVFQLVGKKLKEVDLDQEAIDEIKQRYKNNINSNKEV